MDTTQTFLLVWTELGSGNRAEEANSKEEADEMAIRLHAKGCRNIRLFSGVEVPLRVEVKTES